VCDAQLSRMTLKLHVKIDSVCELNVRGVLRDCSLTTELLWMAKKRQSHIYLGTAMPPTAVTDAQTGAA
jgi:hypothetical protein